MGDPQPDITTSSLGGLSCIQEETLELHFPERPPRSVPACVCSQDHVLADKSQTSYFQGDSQQRDSLCTLLNVCHLYVVSRLQVPWGASRHSGCLGSMLLSHRHNGILQVFEEMPHRLLQSSILHWKELDLFHSVEQRQKVVPCKAALCSIICSEGKQQQLKCPPIGSDLNFFSLLAGELLLLSSVIFLLRVVCGCPTRCRCHSPSQSVDCSRQGLAEIPPDLPPQTLTLHLQDNQIHQLPAFAFRSVPHLRTLNLYNNSLSDLAPGVFHGLQHLQVLNLTQNSLHSLESRLFHSLPRLRELDLSSNNISHLPISLGKPWENLTVFAIQQNQLQQLDRELLESMPNVRLLLLKDNLWKCNCHLLSLKLWLEKFIYKGGITDSVTCASPDTWKGKDLLKIPHELYQPCPFPSLGVGTWGVQQLGSAHRPGPGSPESPSTGQRDRSECELKPKPRPVNLRHAVATVVITGVVCGIVCLMMLAAAIYGCTYAAVTAQYNGGRLAQTDEPVKMEGKGPHDLAQA
ncbi:leucine-rich repeat and transmembrane domain-containing protein 1 [Lynx rufus]|uniref:leucine-rich repeat and transmembrane domain-containing protein 1 n=1 Tax=Lynx rufus TaxID=61384 RepID=UPI001F125466|nr:leucine-rich repeat and transmembrane domain-containing protein 1 [Lynx rufus]